MKCIIVFERLNTLPSNLLFQSYSFFKLIVSFISQFKLRQNYLFNHQIISIEYTNS